MRAGASAHARHRGFGWTPLHFAANAGARDVAFLLVSPWRPGKAEVNARDNCRRTPLFYALDKNRTECARLLWKFGGRADLHFLVVKILRSVQRIDDGNSLVDDRHEFNARGSESASQDSGA